MKKLSFTFIAAAALLLAACNDKENVIDNRGNGEPVMATFKITAPKTYADGKDIPGSDDENKIETVEFYMCGSDGTRDESIYAYHKYTGAADEEISFLVKPGDGKKILVAVNTELGEQPGVNHGDLEQLIEAAKLDNTNSQRIEAGKFVMSGKQVANVVEDETTNEITIALSRLASKVEPPVATSVTVRIPDEDLKDIFADNTVTASGVTFTMTGYALINGHNSSYLYTYYNDADDEKSSWRKWTPQGTYYKTTYTGTGENQQIASAYSGTQNGSAWLQDLTVFVYENQPKDTLDLASGIAGFTKNTTYAFLVRGTLTKTADNTALTRYWRVNLIRDDNYKIFRNTIYRVTLKEVRTVGYGTPEEAEDDEDNGKIVPSEDQTGIQATIDIVPWRLKTQDADF